MRAVNVIAAVLGLVVAGGLLAYFVFPQQVQNLFLTRISVTQAAGSRATPPATPAPGFAPTPPPAAPALTRGTASGYLRASEPIQSKQLAAAPPVVCRGVTYEKAYLVEDGYGALIEFNIQGDKQQLDYGFGYADDHPTDPNEKHKAILQVIADGQVIDGPLELRPSEPPIFRSVAVGGVFKLMFKIEGNDYKLRPLLIDPSVK